MFLTLVHPLVPESSRIHLSTSPPPEPAPRARCVRAFTTAPESRAPHGLPVVLLRARPPALRGSRPPRPLIWARRAPAPAPLPALLPCRRPQSAWPPRLGSRAPRRQGRSAQRRPRGSVASSPWRVAAVARCRRPRGARQVRLARSPSRPRAQSRPGVAGCRARAAAPPPPPGSLAGSRSAHLACAAARLRRLRRPRRLRRLRRLRLCAMRPGSARGP